MDQNPQTDVHLKSILSSPIRVVPNNQSNQTTTPTNTQNIPQIKPIFNPTGAINVLGESSANIILQNCVTTVDLKTKLHLSIINSRTRNSEYNPARFHGLVMRLREPRTTALIFGTGKIVCTGSKSEEDALLASKKFARIIQKLGFNIKFECFKIQNIVATCDLRFPIKLENLCSMHSQFCSYEPELFPGVIYRMIKPHICLLIFVNGKIVFTGAKSRNDIKEALDNIYPILRSFRKN